MVLSVLLYSQNKNTDFMEQFEIYTEKKSFEISLLLLLSHNQCVSPNIRNKWLKTFHLLSKSIKIHSLKNIINKTELIQKYLFNSCTEYKKYSHFIQNDLIPIIIDYEITNFDLISEIMYLYQDKIDQNRDNMKTSIFNILGWSQFILFSLLTISDFILLLFPLYSNSIHFIKYCVAPILLIIFSIHLFLAIKTFKKRRIFCYYLQCLSPQINTNSYKYTSYILEGFNISNISLFLNIDYNKTLKLIPPNHLNTYNIMILSLKYLSGITYCLCIINYYIGLISIFLLPIIIGTVSNIDSIYDKLYRPTYHDIITFYQNSGNMDNIDYQQIATDDTESNDRNNIQSIYKQDKWRYFCRFNSYLLLYSLIMCCVWPLLLLTPFVFGFGIMCSIDPGIEYKWTMRQFCRYWSAFMAIKVVLGMSIVTICDLCWDKVSNSTSNGSNPLNNNDNNDNNDVMDDIDEYDPNSDAYNTLCFTAMNVVSILVLIALIFGINSLWTQIFRLICFFIIYIWFIAFSIKQIIPENQRVINWKRLFKFKWINSNLLHTKF